MNKPQKHLSDANIPQFLVLGILSLIILVDKIPVVIDYLAHRDNLRLHDGWGDGIKDFFYFITIIIVSLTMKYKTNKRDFIAVLLFGLAIMLCISAIGFYKFLIETIITVIMLIYLIFAFVTRKSAAHYT